MARPSKLTPELQVKLVHFIEEGNYVSAACAAAGISRRTFNDWMALGAKRAGSVYADFRAEVMTARRRAESNLVGIIKAHARQDWKAAAWLLQHGPTRNRWRRQDRIDHTVAANGAGGALIVAGGSREEYLAALKEARERLETERTAAQANGSVH